MEFIINNIFLVAIAVISGAMLLYPMLRSGAGGPRVDATEATRLINREDALVVDVREPAEFANGRILGARNIPLSQLEARAADLQKHKTRPIILSCETGKRSDTAVSVLKAKGFERAVNLTGGLVAWKQAGLPVEK